MSIIAQNNEIIFPFDTTVEEDIIDFDFLTIDFFNEINLYLEERHKENQSHYELFNTTKEEIENTLFYNKFWEIQKREQKNKREQLKKAYENRFRIPIFKTKKELENLKKETKNKINELDKEWLNGGRESVFLELEIEGYEEKLKKIRTILKKGIDNDFNSNLLKAKSFPIESLIEFNRAGFAKCPFHGNGMERTPSLKLYKNRNKCHCFSCAKDADPIDVYMQLNNCSINEAIKNLK